MWIKHYPKMKKLLFSIYLLLHAFSLQAQVHFVEKGKLKVGIRVYKDQINYPIDSLCEGFEPETHLPINLIIPEGSSLGINTDSIQSTDIALVVNNKLQYINRPEVKMNGFSMSSSPGSEQSYVFIDEQVGDTLAITWKVGYSSLELSDLYPAEYFSNFVAYQFQNIFSSYPDSSQYNWSDVEYVDELNERGLPVNPSFPYKDNGLYFVVDQLTEDAKVQLIGFHESLQGYDPENPFALFLYEDLSPGDYTFYVQPFEGAPEELSLSYPFTILKPWWLETPTLIGGSILVVILIGGILFIAYSNKQEKQKQQLEWAKQLTEAELKAIRAQLNPHFLFNALSSIQNLVSQQKNEAANTYITKLSRLLREVLSASNSQFHELEQELNLIQLYLELEQLRFSFTSRIQISEQVSLHQLVPVMLLQPYVENAVKHGVAGMGKNGVIQIDIQQKDQLLLIDILDNGPGLSKPTTGSSGLHLSEERIRNLNKLYAGEASVEIKNREDGVGVQVRIKLPLE